MERLSNRWYNVNETEVRRLPLQRSASHGGRRQTSDVSRVILAAIACLCLGHAASAGGDPKARLDKIDERIKGDQVPAAIKECHQLVADLAGHEPLADRASFLHQCGQRFFQLGHYEPAKAVFEKVLGLRDQLMGKTLAARNQKLALFNGNAHDTVLLYAFAVGEFGVTAFDYGEILRDLAKLYDYMDAVGKAKETYRECDDTIAKATAGLTSSVKYLDWLIANAEKKYADSARKWRSRYADYLKHVKALSAVVENNRGLMCDGMGQLADAERHYVKSREIARSIKDRPNELQALSGLGLLAYRQKKFDQAIEFFEEMRTGWQAINSKSSKFAEASIALGMCYFSKEQLGKARALFESASAVLADLPQQRLHGLHAINLSSLLCAEQKYDEARKVAEEALAIYRRLCHDDHPDLAVSRIDLARTYCCTKDWSNAAKVMDQVRHGLGKHIHRVLSMQSRSQQLEFFENKNARWLHAALTLGLSGRDDQDVVEMSAEWLLNGKAVSMPVAASRSLLARDSKSPRAAKLLGDLLDARTKIAAAVRLGQGRPDLALLQLEQQLSADLARETGAAETEEWVTLDAVRRHLGDAVLIEIARFAESKFTARKPDWDAGTEKYVAWIIPPHGQGDIAIVDLGAAGPIDEQVALLHEAINAKLKPKGKKTRQLREMIEKPLAALGDLLLPPLRPHVEQYKRWVISPDGELWRLPWVALTDGDDYLVMKRTVSYVISGRHVVPQRYNVTIGGPAIIAGIDYAGLFDALPQSATEGKEIKPNLERYVAGLGTKSAADLITGKNATEKRFFTLSRPAALVLSTHAFFSETPKDADILERCGIAFAQTNDKQSGDGIAFGIELLDRLDLRGTDLVVLSACQTAQGDVHNGEGAKSLQYAFQLAGARSVLGTLWSVPDTATALLTIDFFTHLANGDDKATALCQAQRGLVSFRRDLLLDDHPMFWAGFTLSGQWKTAAP